MTSIKQDEDVQHELLTPEQLFETTLQLLTTKPNAEYPHNIGNNQQRAWCSWEWYNHEGIPYKGVIAVVIGADASVATGSWMRPNRITMRQHVRGRERRIVFRIRENDPIECRRMPPDNLIRLMQGLRLEDAFEIE